MSCSGAVRAGLARRSGRRAAIAKNSVCGGCVGHGSGKQVLNRKVVELGLLLARLQDGSLILLNAWRPIGEEHAYSHATDDDKVDAFSDYEFIVIGTIGRTGLTRRLVGNTAERVLQRVPCSVVAVEPEGFAATVHVNAVP